MIELAPVTPPCPSDIPSDGATMPQMTTRPILTGPALLDALLEIECTLTAEPITADEWHEEADRLQAEADRVAPLVAAARAYAVEAADSDCPEYGSRLAHAATVLHDAAIAFGMAR